MIKKYLVWSLMATFAFLLSVYIIDLTNIRRFINNLESPFDLIIYPFSSTLFVFLQLKIIINNFPKLYKTYMRGFLFSGSECYDGKQRVESGDSCVVVSREQTIVDLNNRISNLNERMLFIIWSIVASITIAVFVIIFAGRLTSIDASAVGAVDRLGAEITSLEKKISDIEIERIRSARNIAAESAKTTTDKLSEEAVTPSLHVKRIEKYEEFLKQYESLLKDAWEKEIKSEKGYGDDRYIVATAITRTGVVLVLVFLVQILIGLYRYNTRLVAFYQSRKDFISLWDGNIGNISKFAELVTPSGVDFGKDPKHPLEDIINAIAARIPKGQKAELSEASSPDTPPKARASSAPRRKALAEAES